VWVCVGVCVCVFLGLEEMSFRGPGRGRGGRFGGLPGIQLVMKMEMLSYPRNKDLPVFIRYVCVRVHFDFFEGNFLLLTNSWNLHCATWFLLLRN
jgi:hypothetical protein